MSNGIGSPGRQGPVHGSGCVGLGDGGSSCAMGAGVGIGDGLGLGDDVGRTGLDGGGPGRSVGASIASSSSRCFLTPSFNSSSTRFTSGAPYMSAGLIDLLPNSLMSK